jgi:hypothetical protein
MRSITLASSLLMLAACTTARAPIKPQVEQVPVEVAIPVATGCIATNGRPDPIKPLRDQKPLAEWNKLAPGAKAAAIQAQAGIRMNITDLDRAATSACK